MKRTLLCLVVLGGCLEAEDDTVQFAEDFEHGLDLWGRTGETALVTTNHPGEHAVALAPGASISHALQINRAIDGDDNPWSEGFSDGNWIEYSGDCRGRPSLTLEPATNPPGRDVIVRLVIEGPTAPDFFRSKHMFPALPAFVPQPDPDEPGTPQAYDVRFTSVVVASLAPCRVDNLRLMVSGGTLGY